MRAPHGPLRTLRRASAFLLALASTGAAWAQDDTARLDALLAKHDRPRFELGTTISTESAGGSCKTLPEVCRPACVTCKCDTVPNPVLCLTVCNVPKACREALVKAPA